MRKYQRDGDVNEWAWFWLHGPCGVCNTVRYSTSCNQDLFSFCLMWDIEDAQIHKHDRGARALEMVMKHSHSLSSPRKCNVQLEQTWQVREVSRLVVCMAQSVKTKGKAPFHASKRVVSDLRLTGNKTFREGESHGKSLPFHKAPWSIGNRSKALVLATA